MSNDLVKDLELVLIVYRRLAQGKLIHAVGWVLSETRDYVLLVTEFYEDPEDLERCSFGSMKKIMKDDIRYRRPIDQAVNPFENAGGIDPLTETTVNEFVNQMRKSPILERDEAKVNQIAGFIEDDETKWWVGMTPRCVWGVDINPNLREVIKAFKISGSQTVYLVYDDWTITRVPENPNSKDSAILESPDPIPQPETKLIPERQAEELSRGKNYVNEQLMKGDGGKVYHEEDAPMKPDYVNEQLRQAGTNMQKQATEYVKIVANVLAQDISSQQNKYERWWLHEVPVEINGIELNPERFKIINVEYRLGLNGKGDVKIILQDLKGYIVEPEEGESYPKKSQVKLLEDDK